MLVISTPRWLAGLLAGALLTACADDGPADEEVGETGSSSESESSSGESGTASSSESGDSTDASSSETTDSTETTATDSTDSTDSTETTTSDSTDTEGCVPIAPIEPVDHPAFSGSGNCEGVHDDVVLADQAAVDAHTDAFCSSLAMCIFPAPPCDPPPMLPNSRMILYTYAEGSGCSFGMNILSVEDCGAEIVVTADFQQQGPCAVIGYAWDAVAIPSSAKPVQFVVQ